MPEPAHIAGEHTRGPAWQRLTPHPVGELLPRHRSVDIDRQGGEYAPLPGMSEIDRSIVGPALHLTQNANTRRHLRHAPPVRQLPAAAVFVRGDQQINRLTTRSAHGAATVVKALSHTAGTGWWMDSDAYAGELSPEQATGW
ncbi:hypothetical protein GCM10012275_20860 [Longimycelium tulufanense]|uniref:Uncharacterized protein n=1 Tax=Longimycelium tulufanense TaxID=907463 RepID=A0A8J3CBN9_9PSEU|nr:hypothetical protein GCM10012275_20860 [Longimycelium tulufanense]